ncbi:hypothetical protein HPP92_016636 [Vanilla planifolia]|uniref:Uncharacterized protein n=1 Tax=Vanilla planifolia TaxID=51239 RepID=A0A835UTJ3_VANPL|nr:hypothetical protein HPP92_016636 [Vanilla planifolia]
MEAPAEELLKKIQDLEIGHAILKQEMSKLIPTVRGEGSAERRRSQSVSPQRTSPAASAVRRRSGGFDRVGARWRAGSSLCGHSSRLQRESRDPSSSSSSGGCVNGGSGIALSDRQYPNILQSMGQSVHVFDLDGRITFWLLGCK